MITEKWLRPLERSQARLKVSRHLFQTLDGQAISDPQPVLVVATMDAAMSDPAAGGHTPLQV
jgi:hypothetical protein